MVAFSDFECPFCSRAVPTLKQIEDTYKDKVRIAFKHLPLSFHQNAQIAAEASMAANEQGKFWEFHDKLFENQRQLDRPSLEKYAQDLGLNVGQVQGGARLRQVQEAGRGGRRSWPAKIGATGTPTFFVNGKSVVGAQPFDAFKPLIDAELAGK